MGEGGEGYIGDLSSSGVWQEERDWGVTLSAGEAQRLSLARVFYHQPRLVLLDEATSAVSQDLEVDHRGGVATGGLESVGRSCFLTPW